MARVERPCTVQTPSSPIVVSSSLSMRSPGALSTIIVALRAVSRSAPARSDASSGNRRNAGNCASPSSLLAMSSERNAGNVQPSSASSGARCSPRSSSVSVAGSVGKRAAVAAPRPQCASDKVSSVRSIGASRTAAIVASPIFGPNSLRTRNCRNRNVADSASAGSDAALKLLVQRSSRSAGNARPSQRARWTDTSTELSSRHVSSASRRQRSSAGHTASVPFDMARRLRDRPSSRASAGDANNRASAASSSNVVMSSRRRTVRSTGLSATAASSCARAPRRRVWIGCRASTGPTAPTSSAAGTCTE